MTVETTLMQQLVETVERPAFIPPSAPDPRGRCYICGGAIGIFTWTDFRGTAHPWCVPGEKERWTS